MIRTLRGRLLLAMSGVLAAAIATVALYSGAVAQREFGQFLLRNPPSADRVPAASLAGAWQRGSWPEVQRSLSALCLEQRLQCVILDEQAAVVAVHPPFLRQMTIRPIADRGLSLEGSRNGARQSLMLKGIGRPLLAGARPIGTLYLFAGPERGRELRHSFTQPLRGWLLAGLIAALLLALIATATIFRRLLAPVEELNSAVRAVAAGRRDVRIAAHGGDEIAALARSFNELTEALHRGEEARRNMVSDVAHELRTPLTSVRCQIEAVQDGVVPADARLLASLHEEMMNLSRLVDDLQQLSLAEAGRLRLEMAGVPLEEIVVRAFESAVVEPGLMVRVDQGRMVQVFRNLVSNARTYARETVTVNAFAKEGQAVIVVSDDGPGIPPDHLERIFDRFHRADPSRSRATGGAGLGLAIARELVILHGGTITARNRAEGGAELTVTLPLVPFIRTS